jgi:hypothetical protein
MIVCTNSYDLNLDQSKYLNFKAILVRIIISLFLGSNYYIIKNVRK